MRSPHNSDDSPYRQPQSHVTVSHAWQTQKTSALAILSLLSGVMAFPMMCLCFVSIPFSLVAIVSGHMARGIVRQSQGQYAGAEIATFGLLTGYTSLILTVGILLFTIGSRDSSNMRIVVNSGSNGSGSVSEILLDAAEAMLLRDERPATFANDSSTGDASLLASHFVEALGKADSLLFTETGDQPAAQSRTYRAFVQLNDNSCAILLYVPEFDRFTDSAKKTLSQVAWLTAQRTLDSTLLEGSDLAVAVYSSTGLQNAMIGEVRISDEFDAGLNSSDTDRSRLFPFFPKPSRPQPPQHSQLPSDEDARPKIDTNPNISELPETHHDEPANSRPE
ncbi:MAG: DUF4190 domain-containing protein [Planctomycetaceae bacterium]